MSEIQTSTIVVNKISLQQWQKDCGCSKDGIHIKVFKDGDAKSIMEFINKHKNDFMYMIENITIPQTTYFKTAEGLIAFTKAAYERHIEKNWDELTQRHEIFN